jgi:hypothetical protein
MCVLLYSWPTFIAKSSLYLAQHSSLFLATETVCAPSEKDRAGGQSDIHLAHQGSRLCERSAKSTAKRNLTSFVRSPLIPRKSVHPGYRCRKEYEENMKSGYCRRTKVIDFRGVPSCSLVGNCQRPGGTAAAIFRKNVPPER